MLVDYDNAIRICCDDIGGSKEPQNEAERTVLKLLDAFCDIVRARYGTPRCSSFPNLRKTPYYEGFYRAAESIYAAGKSPGAYISLHFENHRLFNKAHHIGEITLKSGKVVSATAHPGVGYPSLNAIAADKHGLLEVFLQTDTYHPTFFVYESEEKYWREQFLLSVRLHCEAYDMTADEYWTDPEVLLGIDRFFYPYACEELRKRAQLFERVYGGSVDEFIEDLAEMIGGPRATFRDIREGRCPLFDGSTGAVMLTDEPTDWEQDRISFITSAREQGVDTDTPTFHHSLFRHMRGLGY